MSPKSLRRWSWVHKWTSLVCTVFMLLLWLTGLPLIFHHEIGHLTGTEVEAPTMPAATPMANLDELLAAARALHPQRVVQFLFRDPDETALWMVALNDSATAAEGGKTVAVDARTAKVLAEPKFDEGFMHVMLQLHVDLFAGLPGKLFLGLMGLLMVAAIVSGVVLYAPFMRKLDFGTVRRDRTCCRGFCSAQRWPQPCSSRFVVDERLRQGTSDARTHRFIALWGPRPVGMVISRQAIEATGVARESGPLRPGTLQRLVERLAAGFAAALGAVDPDAPSDALAPPGAMRRNCLRISATDLARSSTSSRPGSWNHGAISSPSLRNWSRTSVPASTSCFCALP